MSTIWEVDDADEEIEGLDASGRADPAYAAALGLISAPFGRRFLAVSIDVACYLIVQIPFWVFSLGLLLMFARGEITLYGLVTHPHFFLAALMAGITALLTVALLIVQGVFQGRMGLTIGKGIVGIRSVNVERLDRPGFWRIVLRTLIVGMSNILPLIGPALFFSSALRDPEGRGRAWHDHASHVWLIDVKKGLDPYDGKRMRIARKVVKVEVAPEAPALPSLASAGSGEALSGYRPAHSVGAGVLGVAKPRRAGRDDSVGIASKGMPPAAAAAMRSSEDHRVVLGVPPEIAARAQHQSPEPPSAPVVPDAEPTPQTAPPQAAPPHATPVPPAAPTPQVVPAPQAVSAPQAPAPVAVVSPSPAAVRLVLDSGSELVLSEAAIFGRHPSDQPDFGPAQCVPVADDTRSVSKTHFALRPTDAGIEVRDLGSTNGTFVLRAGVESEVAPGAPVMAAVGDVVRFGDRTVSIGTV